MPSVNPFTPMFGIVPAYMAGRQHLIQEMVSAFDNGYGDPNLCSILIGARGSGKTSLLTYCAREAESRGWISVSTTAVPGMLEDIYEGTLLAAQEFLDPSTPRHLSGISVGQFLELEWENEKPREGNWRTRMNLLLDQLQKQNVGLLITVDEVRTDIDEMKQLAVVYQHFVREQRTVALLLAGLPHNVSLLLVDKDISFLRRARQHKLGRIPDNEIRDALKATIAQAGRSIESEALDLCVRAIEGFPYMMQLVGYRVWAENPARKSISATDAEHGILLAREELATGVLQSTYRELSEKDLQFLTAMLEDDGDSSLAAIAQRMGVKSNYASQYKRRLLEQGIIGERGRGYVGFDLPLFKEYLQDHRD